MKIGWRPGAYDAGSADGSNQNTSSRVTVIGTPRSASTCGAQAPGATTSRSASIVPRVVVTRTPESSASQPSARSSNLRSAPAATARRTCSWTVRSGRTNPLRVS